MLFESFNFQIIHVIRAITVNSPLPHLPISAYFLPFESKFHLAAYIYISITLLDLSQTQRFERGKKHGLSKIKSFLHPNCALPLNPIQSNVQHLPSWRPSCLGHSLFLQPQSLHQLGHQVPWTQDWRLNL